MNIFKFSKFVIFTFLRLGKCIPDYAAESCKLPRITGRCRGHFRRYYFNYEEKSCQPFVFGGCGGNANNFNSKHLCDLGCNFKTFRGRIYGDGINSDLTLSTSNSICGIIFLPFTGLNNPCHIGNTNEHLKHEKPRYGIFPR